MADEPRFRMLVNGPVAAFTGRPFDAEYFLATVQIVWECKQCRARYEGADPPASCAACGEVRRS